MKVIKLLSAVMLGGALVVSLTSCATWGARQNKKHEQQRLASKRYSGVVQQIKNAAFSGDPDAQYALGYMYYYGKSGLKRDPEVGHQWIAKAAEQGQPQAVQAIALLQQAEHPDSAYIVAAQSQSNRFTKANKMNKSSKLNKADKNTKKTNNTKKSPTVHDEKTGISTSFTTILTPTEQQLLKKSRNAYTLQLLGRHDERDVNRFIQRNGLLAKAKVYRTYFHGSDWYVLTYGIFKSEHEAFEAIKRLPKNLQKLHPWVKPISMVQVEILKTRRHLKPHA